MSIKQPQRLQPYYILWVCMLSLLMGVMGVMGEVSAQQVAPVAPQAAHQGAAAPTRQALPQADSALQAELQRRTREALDQAPVRAGVPDVRVNPAHRINIEEVLQQAAKLDQPNEQKISGPMVFVSLSMPRNTLTQLAKDAKKVNGVLIMRGTVGGSLRQTVTAVQRLSQQGVEIMIDPLAFKRYGVQVVPSVMVDLGGGQGCDAQQACAQRSALVEGDVSLSYALQHIHKTAPEGLLRQRVGQWVAQIDQPQRAGRAQ
jgi:type-F conjugative transfer system pilin assembly protein TrbC